MRAQLVPVDGGSAIEILKDLSVVGRSEDCDIRFEQKSISKYHCVVVRTDGLLLLRDLGSTNGTRVNDIRVRRAHLLPNDRVTFANLEFRVLFGAALVQALEDERTQGITAADLVPHNRPNIDTEDESSGVRGPVEVLQNNLPDIYPDDLPGQKTGEDQIM